MPCSTSCGCRNYGRPDNQRRFDRDFFVVILCLAALLTILSLVAYLNNADGAEPQDTLPPVPGFPPAPYAPCAVTINKTPHDADTITDVTIHLPFGVDIPHVSIRAYGYDAWEVNKVRHSEAAGPITDEEVQKGLAARDALVALLWDKRSARWREDRLYVDDSGQRDPYGRKLCWFWVRMYPGDEVIMPTNGWLNLAAYMRANGHQRQGTSALENSDHSPTPLPSP